MPPIDDSRTLLSRASSSAPGYPTPTASYTARRSGSHRSPNLWLVGARPGQVREQWWSRLTRNWMETVSDAWSIGHAYDRRWQIEPRCGYTRTELAMERPRRWRCDRREKLLVTLAYALLLHPVPN